MSFTPPTAWSPIGSVYPGTPIVSGDTADEQIESLILNDRLIRARCNPIHIAMPTPVGGHITTASTSYVVAYQNVPIRLIAAQAGLIWVVRMQNATGGNTCGARITVYPSGATTPTDVEELTTAAAAAETVESISTPFSDASDPDGGGTPFASDTTIRVKLEIKAITGGTAHLLGWALWSYPHDAGDL